MGNHNRILSVSSLENDVLKKAFINKHHYDDYSRLGDRYFQENNLEQAFIYYQKALRSKVEILGEYHLSTAKSYHDLASFYLAGEVFEMAQMFFESALSIRENLLEFNSLELANSYSHLGLCHYYLFNYREAHHYMEKALKIKEPMLGDSDQKLEVLRKNLKDVEKALSENRAQSFLSKFYRFITLQW